MIDLLIYTIMPQIHLPCTMARPEPDSRSICSPDPARSTERPARKHLLQQPSNRQLTDSELGLYFKRGRLNA